MVKREEKQQEEDYGPPLDLTKRAGGGEAREEAADKGAEIGASVVPETAGTEPSVETGEKLEPGEMPVEEADIIEEGATKTEAVVEEKKPSLDSLYKILVTKYKGLLLKEKLEEIKKEELKEFHLSSGEETKIINDLEKILIALKDLSEKERQEGKTGEYKHKPGDTVYVIKIDKSDNYILARSSGDPRKILIQPKEDAPLDKEKLEQSPPGQILKVKIIKEIPGKKPSPSGRGYAEALLVEFINEPVEEAPAAIQPSTESINKISDTEEQKREEALPTAPEVSPPTGPEVTPPAPPTPETKKPLTAEEKKEEGERIKAEIEAAEIKFRDEAKKNYLKVYSDYQKISRGESKLKSIYNKFKGFLTRKEEKAQISDEKENLKIKLDKAHETYLAAKSAYAQTLYENKDYQLRLAGKKPEEIKQELKEFLYDEIFKKLVVGEEGVLQAAKAADFPPKEKGIIRKALERWTKLPMPVRVLISTAIVIGAVAAAPLVGLGGGFAAVGASGAAFFAGQRYVRGLVSIGLGMLAGKGVDKLLGNIEEEFKKEKEKLGAEFKEKPGPFNLKQMSEQYHQMREKKSKRERNRVLIKAGVMVATGIGSSIGLGMLEHAYLGPGVTAPEPAKPATAEELPDLTQKMKALTDQATAKGQDFLTTERAEIHKNMAVLHRYLEAKAAHIQELATVHKTEGITHAIQSQLLENPEAHGFSSGLTEKQAAYQAYLLAKQQGFVDATGQETWVRFDPQHPVRFVLGDDNKIIPQGEEGYTYWHEPSYRPSLPAEAPAMEAPAPAPAAVPELKLPPAGPAETWGGTGAMRAMLAKEALGAELAAHYPPTDLEHIAIYDEQLRQKLAAANELVNKYQALSAGQADQSILEAAQAVKKSVLQEIDIWKDTTLHGRPIAAYDIFDPEETGPKYWKALYKIGLNKEIWSQAGAAVEPAPLVPGEAGVAAEAAVPVEAEAPAVEAAAAPTPAVEGAAPAPAEAVKPGVVAPGPAAPVAAEAVPPTAAGERLPEVEVPRGVGKVTFHYDEAGRITGFGTEGTGMATGGWRALSSRWLEPKMGYDASAEIKLKFLEQNQTILETLEKTSPGSAPARFVKEAIIKHLNTLATHLNEKPENLFKDDVLKEYFPQLKK